jgi:hypothetical protein
MYAPDEITEDYIENICDDLKCALTNVLEGDAEEADKADEIIGHLEGLADELRQRLEDQSP